MSETARRVIRFIAVGCMAAAVHLGVVVLLVAVAVMTYLVSSRWAFLGNPQH